MPKDTNTTAYGRFVNGPLPNLIDPRALRGHPSDAELGARRRRAARDAEGARVEAEPPAERYTRGLDPWTISILVAANAPLQGSGRGGAWTKADFEALVA